MQPCHNKPRQCLAPCGRGWRRTAARSRSRFASSSERSSSSEASGDREIMSSRQRPVMNALTRGILKSVALVALLSNGFIAAFVGGLAVGPTVERVGEQLIRFTEAEG